MKYQRIIAAILALSMLFVLSACAQDRDLRAERDPAQTAEPAEQTETPAEPTPEPVEVKMPTATSDDVELYTLDAATGRIVVNVYGQPAASYTLDSVGNIMDKDGRYVVAAENVKEFKAIEKLKFSEPEYAATLAVEEEVSKDDEHVTTYKQTPVNVTLLMSAEVENATNHIIVLEIQDKDIAEIKANANAKILADGAFKINDNQIAVELPENGNARVTVTAKAAGKTSVTALNLSGVLLTSCVLNVENGPTPGNDPESNLSEIIIASDDPMTHAHSYKKTVVPPTPYEKGYTEYVCECGHSYRDDYTAPLPMPTAAPEEHVHVYNSSVVAPTATERGYTLHVCECGDSYKDSFVAPTGK